MGDGLAVEIAQQSHFNLLPQLGDCMKEHEVVAYRRPVPRGPFYEFLTVDDHIGLQRLDKHVPFCDQQTRDVEVFTGAYSQVGLVPHPGKRQRQVTSGTVLGAEIDGVKGVVSAPRGRVAMLMFVTSILVQQQRATRRILQSLFVCSDALFLQFWMQCSTKARIYILTKFFTFLPRVSTSFPYSWF